MAIFSMGVTMGPIMGPTLGGWLTDAYSWRYVFYVNLPLGILSITGLVLFMKETGAQPSLRFSWYGFAMLALACGSFQLLLDRGQELDWFTSREIIIEAVVAGLALYLFVVHMFTADKPFLSLGLFRDRNFSLHLVRAAVHLGPVGALSAEPGGLSGADGGLGDGAARPGHDHVDVGCQPTGHARRPAQDHGDRAAGAGGCAV
jgi:MFS family permease